MRGVKFYWVLREAGGVAAEKSCSGKIKQGEADFKRTKTASVVGKDVHLSFD